MGSCHGASSVAALQEGGAVALLGPPNVGKSVLFRQLTGRYVLVANYPGTTVEVTRGAAQVWPDTAVIDTPGVVSFPPVSEDEQVASRVLLDEQVRAVVHVGDAKSLRRTLLLTVQLAELGLPLVLALNMADEAARRGLAVDPDVLSGRLGAPVVLTTAISGDGVDELVEAVATATPPEHPVAYPSAIEEAVTACAALLPESSVSARGLALAWLSRDAAAEEWIAARLSEGGHAGLVSLRERLERELGEPASTAIQHARLAAAERLGQGAVRQVAGRGGGLGRGLGMLTIHPVFGVAVLLAVLYGLYRFVGVFGAGTLVGLVEEELFGGVVNPWVEEWAYRLLPSGVADFLAGEYGLWTMGMTYALALVLPIVTTFFLAFGVLEDSGYLARLTVLANRFFRFLGLNGKAVLPLVLGLGCVTMATMTTRILESKRDRLLVILLLALAVPCSAQLGVVLGMLASVSLAATVIWGVVLLVVLLAVGWLAARLLPGERSTLLVELPPLRRPSAANVAVKTAARLEWYLKEVVPLFLAGTALLFVLDKVGALPGLIRAAEPVVVEWLGLPAETASAFLLGFLRRDFGATGLFVAAGDGLLTGAQIVVAMVTITLFIPCVASVLMIGKERGWRTAAAMAALVFPLAFVVGGVLQRILGAAGWSG